MAATASDKLTIFTGAFRSEFMNAYEGLRPVATPQWQAFTSVIDSTVRVEEYPWMSPPPRLKRYLGKRRYSIPDWSKYRVENLEYSAEEAFRLRDVEDDQVGGYKLRAAAMAADVKDFPGRECIKALRDGASNTCFDGTNFFADSHTIGTGDNSLTKDCASNDAASHTVIALVKTGTIKPVIWQNRKDKGLMDNSANPVEMNESKQCRFWYDYEGAAGYGFWWDAIKVAVTDTPTVNEVEDIIKDVEKTFRGFKLDKADSGEDEYYIHEQMAFTAESLLYIVNPSLENLFRAVLTSENLQAGTAGGTKTNIYRGHGDLMVSAYLGS